ncbi:MAG: DUF763 domain-containing protein [Thermoprotei archaeon]|nr:MAG: DUF763 domain-containing protein [Thermoprotei archaeon]
MKRGIAELPLHVGHVPQWLASRMKRLAAIVVELVVDEYGTRGLLERLADPVWFQALNNIIGMDWDSSGSTTVTTAILKEVLAELDLGVYAAGGKGGKSLRTPSELAAIADRLGLDGAELVRTSILVAKVDNAALQDGYQLYHHTFFVDEAGRWAVVQQGMNLKARMARRYHWFSEALRSFTESPHSGICGLKRVALNTVDRGLEEHQKLLVDLSKEDPRRVEAYLRQAVALAKGYRPLSYYAPYRPERARALVKRYLRLGGVSLNKSALVEAREAGVRSYRELLEVRGVGPSTLRALALVAELVYETPPSWRDPVTHPPDPFKFAYAVGGKDGVPFPVDRRTYDELLRILGELKRRVRGGWELRRLAALTKKWSPPPEEKVPT